MYAKAGHLDAAFGLDSPKQHKNHNDDQYRADQTDAAMAETQRHRLAPLVFKKWDYNRVSI